MDPFLPIILIVVFFIIFSICGWCCKRKQRSGIVYGYGTTPVTVITQTNSQAIPPYPMGVHHPMPQLGASPGAPAPGFAPQGYPPYPLGSSAPGGPYPPVGAAPYPPASAAPYQSAPSPANQLPPSYSEAVNQPTQELYSKQSPYNPNY